MERKKTEVARKSEYKDSVKRNRNDGANGEK